MRPSYLTFAEPFKLPPSTAVQGSPTGLKRIEMTVTSRASTHSSVPLIIDGNEIVTNDVFDVTNPRSGQIIHRSSNATVTHALAAVDAAAKAFEFWRGTTPGHRRDLFLKAANILDTRWGELKEYMMEET